MPARRSYAAYYRMTTPSGTMHLGLPSTPVGSALCGKLPPELEVQIIPPQAPHPAGSRVCRDCADWAYPQDPYRNR